MIKCSKCGKEIDERANECPYCKTNFVNSERNNNNSNKVVWITGLIILILVLLLFIPKLVDDKKELDELKYEGQLIQEGKVVSDTEVINEIVNILKERKKEQLNSYITADFTYVNNNGIESNSLYNFWNDLDYLVEDNYDIEKRGSSIQNEETYFVYWNTNNKVIDRNDNMYCLQELRIYLKKVVETDRITYKVYRIILTDN